MMRPSRSGCAVAGVAVLLAACGSFGAAEPTDAPDAAADPATGDAGPGACGHTFCATFDEDPLELGWTAHLRQPTDTKIALMPTPDAPHGGARALRAALGADDDYERNYLRKDVDAGAAKVTFKVTFALRVVTPGTGSIEIGAVSWPPAAEDAEALELELEGDQVVLVHWLGGDLFRSSGAALAPGGWHAIQVVAAFDGTSGASAELHVDGGKIDGTSFTTKTAFAGAAAVQLGVDYTAPPLAPTAIDFDDVTIDVAPTP